MSKRLCRKCNNKIPNRVLIDGIQHVLCNRKFCLSCSPFNKHNTSPYDPIERIGKTWQTYTTEQKEQVKKCLYKRAYTRKQKIIEMKGGHCQQCGYNKSLRALTFHHINRKEKCFGLSLNNLWSKTEEEIIQEANKCKLLCMNCHAETEEQISNSKCSQILKEVKQSFNIC